MSTAAGCFAGVRVVVLAGLAVTASALDQADPSTNANQVPTLDPYAGLTPAQMAQAQATLQQIESSQTLLLPISGQWDANLYKTVEARRVQENLDWISKYNAAEGGSTTDRAAAIYSGDDFQLAGEWTRNPRVDDRQFSYPANSAFQIISEDKNLLADFDKRMNKITNKLNHSKFACGEFDWIAQLAFDFNKAALEKYVSNLAESALAAAPMALIANISPTLYEIVKWLRANAGMDLNAEKVSCHQMEGALTNIGQTELRGEGYADCIKANQGLGTTEAQRVCNQETSPFDGIEDAVGNIQGFDLNTGDINLTQALSDQVNTGQPNDLTDAQQAQSSAQNDFTNAQAQATASPDPGDAPNAPEGSPAMVQWQAAKNQFTAAQQNLTNAQQEVQGAVAQTNATAAQQGPFATLANSLASNLGNIIGNIDLSTKADVQFGRQRQYQLILKFKYHAYMMSLDFTQQLSTHAQILTQSPDDATDLSQSYQHLQAYCFGTMQSPWLRMAPIQITPTVSSYQVRIGYDTFDRLAFLWTAYQNGGSESLARTAWNDEYRYMECINTIALFEIFDFLHTQGEKDKDTVLSQFQNMSPAKNGGKAITDAISKSLDDYLALLQRKRDEEIPLLVQTIYAVNQFPLKRGRGHAQSADKVSPDVQVGAQPQFGR